MALRAKAEESKHNQMANETKRHEDLFNILSQQQKQQREFQQQVQLNQEAMKQQQNNSFFIFNSLWQINNNKIFKF